MGEREKRSKARPPLAGISFRVATPASGRFRVMLDNCPQWYGLRGRILYLRSGDGVVVSGLRALMRASAQTPVPPGDPAGRSARAPP